MKKVGFVAGLCAGIGLSLGTAAFASGSIQAVLFPSKVNFLVNDTVRQMDNADNEVLNYNNKTYIPLRTFAESMGAVVEFVPGSPETGGHNKINIYSGMSANTLGKQDPQGYVSYGPLTFKQASTDLESKTASLTGLLKVNKPLTGKKIELIAMNAEGKRVGSADIDIWDRLQQGDIIELNQALYLSGSISSCQIEVKDSWALTTRDFFHDGMLLMNEGLVFGMGSIDPSQGGLVQTLHSKIRAEKRSASSL
ncbi:copper amine oxidase N-terminal domain-containing protein [Paenibacillus sp. H1-7]|uniref:copper amine oxidase N-terminal domain-containing protein n=1 Tax=Paenibacillus sp. H1-7 TaxID=2282849 RepID=UPI001EF96BBC|nr:copper amine oxidase N-terminal domain-containing protein [Paenibacillus sp. H1-7]